MRHWKFVDRRIDFPSKASKLGLLDEILIQIELLGFQFASTFSPTDGLLRSEELSQVLKLHCTFLFFVLTRCGSTNEAKTKQNMTLKGQKILNPLSVDQGSFFMSMDQ